jgi:1-deoxy-D-xylulose-5-phosphate synthase
MASQGATPVFCVYSSFLQRSYDMLLHDTAIEGLHVVLAVDRAGLVPGDGETHQGLFDVAYLSSVPGMTILSPSNYAELRDLLRVAFSNVSGPVAIRYPRGGEGDYKTGGFEKTMLIREGKDFTLVTYGISVNTAIEAAKELESDDISVEIIKLSQILPIEMDAVFKSVLKTRRLLVLEESAARGSVGEKIAAELALRNASLDKVILKNTGDLFVPCGDIKQLLELCERDVRSVCEAIRRVHNNSTEKEVSV